MPTTKTCENLSGSTQLVYDELMSIGARPVIIDIASNLVEYTTIHGNKELLFCVVSEKSSAIGRVVAENKARTAHIANHLSIPIPRSVVCDTVRDAIKFLDQHKCIVTKPKSGRGGHGVTTNIHSEDVLRMAYAYARINGLKVVAQQHIDGADVRLLVIGGVFCSAVIREPASVVGDGVSTTEQLIDIANTTSPRNDPNFLSVLPIDKQAALRYLQDAMQLIPEANKKVQTTGPANVSLGGSLREASELVTSEMISDSEKIARRLGLGICGVDMMWNQKTNQHYLIEINTSPGIDIHDDPYSGTSSGATQRYAQWLVS